MSEGKPLPTWEELIKNPKLIGGQIFFQKGAHYVGEITRIRSYGNRATFHFAWTAAKTRRGWVTRRLKSITLGAKPVTLSGQGTLLMFDGNTVVFKDQFGPHVGVKQNEVLEQITHGMHKAKIKPVGKDLFTQ